MKILLAVLMLLLTASKSYALDDFDLAKYGLDDTIESTRTGFIVKLITYTTRERLTRAFEKATGGDLPEGTGIRGFAIVDKEEDVCFVHIVPAKIWDDREAMAIMGHEIYHCALADHKEVIINDTAENINDNKEEQAAGDKSVEDLYIEDRRLELEWLRREYVDMGIIIDEDV